MLFRISMRLFLAQAPRFWLAALLLSSTSSRADEQTSIPNAAPAERENLPVAFQKETPSSLADLRSIETHVQQLVSRVSPAVVAVSVGGSTGSGVVISEDGLVLTAAHVCDRPGREVLFIFPDGKRAHGKTLGTDHERDAGLMKIADPGPWPHAVVGYLDQARLGDWVLALGHPGGFDPQRSMVVRMGRIIRLASAMLQTDCTLIGGDSGGPLFDMHGHVVGIHSRISSAIAENFHVPITTYHDTWDRLVKGESWGDQRPRQQPWVGAWGLDHPEGCRLELVHRNGPGERAGLKVGDIVTKINGKPVKDYNSFAESVSQTNIGDEALIEFKRGDKAMSLKVTVEQRRGLGGSFGR